MKDRTTDRERIEADMAAYLAKGGKVDVVPMGVSGDTKRNRKRRAVGSPFLSRRGAEQQDGE